MSEKTIQTIYDEDLPKLLSSLGLKDDFDNGRIRCSFCGEIVTKDNLLTIFSDGKEIKFSCNKESCRSNISKNNEQSS